MSSEKSKNIFRAVKEYFLITLGILIYTCGWTIFLTPNNMFGGGVSGISAIIQFATGIKMGYSYFAINALLLIISLRICTNDTVNLALRDLPLNFFLIPGR